MLLIFPYSVLSTTISFSLPKPWILGKTLYSSPCMIISWLQLHRDLERKTYWLLVLFITNAWREMKHKGHGSKQGQLSQNTICSVTWKKASQTSASPNDNLGSSASPVEPASLDYLLFQYVYFFPWTLQWYWSFRLSKQCQNQVAGNFEQVQYFRPLNCTDSTYLGGRKEK